MVQLKRGLLRTTALCLGLAAPLIVTSQSAEASCSSYAPTSGTTVTCSGTSTSGVSAKSGAANAQLSYEGEAGSDSVAHALTATLKLDW